MFKLASAYVAYIYIYTLLYPLSVYCSWYHPNINRHVAESLLLAKNTPDGTYLLRESSVSDCTLTLSVRYVCCHLLGLVKVCILTTIASTSVTERITVNVMQESVVRLWAPL